jgi:GNAT superfamily N-acetyltransferase
MKIALAETDAQIAACFDVMQQLRPHLVRDEFVPLIRSMMASDGYKLAFLDDGGVRAVAGFRIMHMLHAGKELYVDDLVSDEKARSKGYGRKLLRWLIARAKREKCLLFELDSGTHRVDAHRFYLRERMIIQAFHFRIDLRKPR